jgi:hypothetical protein
MEMVTTPPVAEAPSARLVGVGCVVTETLNQLAKQLSLNAGVARAVSQTPPAVSVVSAADVVVNDWSPLPVLLVTVKGHV